MRTLLALSIASLLSLSIPGIAATVTYQHPDLTIVAKEEPLDTVLKALGKEMRIYITIPTGLNPVVNCDIQQQPIKQALKTLLGDLSYSLEWEEKAGRLIGVTILASGGESAVATISGGSSHTPNAEQPAPVAIANPGGPGAVTAVEQGDHDAPMAPDDAALTEHDATMAEHEARMETEQAEHEARMETERTAMETRMIEEREVQDQRMKEEVARHEVRHKAELEEYLGSKGLQMPEQAD